MKFLASIYVLFILTGCVSHHNDPAPEPIDLTRPGKVGPENCPADRIK